MAEEQPAPDRARTLAWVNSTYFMQGLPYVVVRILSGVYFTDVGVKERYLGYLNFLGIPWNLKFLWAPFVDAYSTKRRWMVGIQLALALVLGVIAALCYAAPAAGDASAQLLVITYAFILMAFLAATNDISIDAYYLEGLQRPGDQAAYSGNRVMAWRVAMVVARTGLVALVAYFALSTGANKHLPWAYGFGLGALLMLAFALGHWALLLRFEAEREVPAPRQVLRSYAASFRTYLQQPKVATVLVFIIVYKLGDEILFSMVTPFLMRELGVTKGDYSWISGTVGAIGTILGAMLGGLWIKRVTLKKAIWPLTLLMNINIWAYIWLAWAKPDPKTSEGLWTIALVHGYEQWAAGLGSAVLLAYLLRTCRPEHKAAHYAIGSAIMSLPGTLLGGNAGSFVEVYGYLTLFVVAFFATIPSMALLPFIPHLEEPKAV